MADVTGEPPLATVRAAYKGAHCRACSAPVIWVKTAAGRSQAVDAEPTLDGRIELRASIGELVAVAHGTPPPEGYLRYRAHAGSCVPRVRGWRGRVK